MAADVVGDAGEGGHVPGQDGAGAGQAHCTGRVWRQRMACHGNFLHPTLSSPRIFLVKPSPNKPLILTRADQGRIISVVQERNNYLCISGLDPFDCRSSLMYSHATRRLSLVITSRDWLLLSALHSIREP